MRHPSQSEQGYTLMIVLLVIVLFSIIGASLLTLNMNSTAKNTSREHTTQAEDLAVKGIDYLLQEIQFEFKKQAEATGGILPNGFEPAFVSFLTPYMCENSSTGYLQGATGDSFYCIEKIENSDVPTVKLVTFKGTGVVDDKEVDVRHSYKLGSTQEGYFLVTFEDNSLNDAKNTEQRTGNIELHGGVLIEGSIYANNELITSNLARYKNTVVPSVLPMIKQISGTDKFPTIQQGAQPTVNTQATGAGPLSAKIETDLLTIADPKLSLPKDISFNMLQRVNQAGDVQPVYINPTNNEQATILKGKNDLSIQFNIIENVNAAKARISNGIVPLKTGYVGSHLLPKLNNYATLSESEVVKNGYYYPTKWSGALATALNTTAPKVLVQGYLPSSLESIAIGDINNFNWTLYGQNTLNSVIFPKNLSLQHGVEIPEDIDLLNWSTNPRLKVNEAYIGGNMVVGVNTKNENNFGLLDNMLDVDALGLLSFLEKLVNFDTPVHLEGTYFVEGDLVISGAQLTGDATFFVKGSTTILFSDIGVQRSYSNLSKFNFISHGPLKIAYVGNNHNNNTQLQASRDFINDVHASNFIGHLHSDQKLTIDGATSNMFVHGSISARDIYISATKGRTQPSCRDVGYYVRTKLIDEIVGPTLGGLLTNRVAEQLINVLLGDEHDGEDYNMVLDKSVKNNVPSYSSNCFEKVEGQQAAYVKPPAYLIDLLGIQLVGAGTKTHPVESRIQMLHNPEPLQTLISNPNIRATFDGLLTITELDPPVEVSRQ